jgi:hypothetical protein
LWYQRTPEIFVKAGICPLDFLKNNGANKRNTIIERNFANTETYK